MDDAATLTEAIRRQLNTILDPCSMAQQTPIGFVDMGLVTAIGLEPAGDGTFDIALTLRTTMPGCLYQPFFERAAQHVLEDLESVREVSLVWDQSTSWTSADMAESSRERLAERRRAMKAQALADQKTPIAVSDRGGTHGR